MLSSIRRTRGHLVLPLVYVCAAHSIALMGCSKRDDDTARATTAGPVIQAGQGGAAAGSGGAVSAGSGGALAGAGGSVAAPILPPAPGPMECGGKTCTPPMGSLLGACCLPDDSCGLGTSGLCQVPDQPGALDSSCPSHEVATAGVTLDGCCKPEGKCGVMSVSGLGCVERTALASFAGGPLDEMACTPSAGGEREDGGVDDSESDAGVSDAGVSTDTPEAPGAVVPVGGDMEKSGRADGGVESAPACLPVPAWLRRFPWLRRPGTPYCPARDAGPIP